MGVLGSSCLGCYWQIGVLSGVTTLVFEVVQYIIYFSFINVWLKLNARTYYKKGLFITEINILYEKTFNVKLFLQALWCFLRKFYFLNAYLGPSLCLS